MFPRLLKCSKNKSFFLFGARATGKSSYLESFWSKSFRAKHSLLWIDLLEPERERTLSLNPSALEQEIDALKAKPRFVVIDEIQKIPKLLDVVHRLIAKKKLNFALTGSSARKLKLGGANLLAGRAFLYKLYPLTFLELGEKFDLHEVLQRGSLPEIFNLKNKKEKNRYLNSYVQVYLKEEIIYEQIIRNIQPFRFFLDVAGQCNGMILNYSRIAAEAGIDYKSCQRYFEILEDTFLGFHLYPYAKSIRKRQIKSPKFYLFDLGVARALSGLLTETITPSNYAFGNAFEHLVVSEAYRINEYFESGYKFSYFRSKDGVEIDLVLERGKEVILVEIKSKNKVSSHDLKSLKSLREAMNSKKEYVLCLENPARKVDGIEIIHWQDGIKNIFNQQ